MTPERAALIPSGRFPQLAGLTLTVLDEDMPCGVCFTAQWHDPDGTLVRQDIHVSASAAGMAMQGAVNIEG